MVIIIAIVIIIVLDLIRVFSTFLHPAPAFLTIFWPLHSFTLEYLYQSFKEHIIANLDLL